MTHSKVLVVDNRGQATSVKASMTDRLIRTLRSTFDVDVVTSALPSHAPYDFSRVGCVVLSGSEYHLPRDLHNVPFSVRTIRWARQTNTPILGICFGMQLLAHLLGGQVSRRTDDCTVAYLAHDIFVKDPVYFNHMDAVVALPPNFTGQGISKSMMSFAHLLGEGVLGVQWHPEGTDGGKQWIVEYIARRMRQR